MARAIRYTTETEEQETARKKNEVTRFLSSVFTNAGAGFGVVSIIDLQRDWANPPLIDFGWLLLAVGTIFVSFLILKAIEPEF
jgi:hypothetical protein